MSLPRRNAMLAGEESAGQFEEFVGKPPSAVRRHGRIAPMLVALLAPDIPLMGENLLWLLLGSGLCLLVGWRMLSRRADARRIDRRAEAQPRVEPHADEDRLAAERAEAQRIAAERQREAAAQAAQAEQDRVATLQAERELQRLAAEQAFREAETRAEAQRQAQRRAEEEHQAVERAEAERIAAECRREAAEQAERERIAALEAEREAQRRAAEQAARAAEAQRQAEQRAAEERLAGERAEAERIAAERRREAAEQAERERIAALQAEREAAARAEAQRLAEWRAEQDRLAAERAAAEEVAALQRRTAKTAAQTLVLVADDSKVVRIKTGRLLAQHQYQVAFANDGLDAVQQIEARRPDVVITDVEMPGMDGFELTRHIRANPPTAKLPVIMITAADDRHREQADCAGVSVLLGKPYPEDALIAHIRLAMGQEGAAPLGAAASAHGALDTVV